MYTAAVLTPLSAQLLRWIMKGTEDLEKSGFLLETPQGDFIPHHMTINLGRFDETLNPKSILGNQAIVKVDKLVYNDVMGVCAANVQEALGFQFLDSSPVVNIQCVNEYPHVTVCLKPGSKPVESNDLLSRPSPHTIEIALDQVYELQAVVQEVK